MKKYLPLFILVVSLTFFAILCAKEWTWLFASSDSGDWLASSQTWMVPQPVGSPLYILLGHVLNVLPGDLTLKMTLVLSCLASAVTVTLVFLIVRKLTKSTLISLTCSILLASSAVFLTQSTVIEEYALVTMLMTGAFWFYVNDKKKTTALFLGLAIAVHIFAAILALLWLVVLWKEWKKWVVPVLIASAVVCVFYSLILLLMHLDTPRLFAGGLNFSSVKTYLFDVTGGIVGTMSIFEAPKRFLNVGGILLVSFSIGLIPAIRSIKPLSTFKLLLVSNIAFILWYVLTCVDPLTWTFIALITPSVVILCGIGLVDFKRKYVYVVLCVSLILTGLNASYLNADKLTNTHFLAERYYHELMSLPDNSIVVTTPGAYSLGLFYVMSEGKDLIPLIYPYIDEWEFWDYFNWLERKYPNVTLGVYTKDIIRANLGKIPIFYAQSPGNENNIVSSLILSGNEYSLVREVEGVK
jgi:hypothetical protein